MIDTLLDLLTSARTIAEIVGWITLAAAALIFGSYMHDHSR